MSFAFPLGHGEVQRRFTQAMRGNQLHHAWLLYGADGIGKTMQARAMAATYLCEADHQAGEMAVACGACHACHMLAAGSHPDFLHIVRLDGKRDINVEQVRDMLSFLALSGAGSDRRVVVLQDTDHLNLHAANAMLKGLEEPAAGSLLLMVCTDLQRLPATVRSRCLLQPMHPLRDEDCRKVLRELGCREDDMSLALALAQGQPGRVAALVQQEVGDALHAWDRLASQLANADLGEINQWITAHVKHVPHHLIADALLLHLAHWCTRPMPFAEHMQLLDAAWSIAAWPERLRRHSLRPAESLLAHVLRLRLALRATPKAA